MNRPPAIYLLCLLHFLLGVNGLVAGIMLVLRPDGSLLGLPPALLSNTVFTDFLVPGIILTLFCGLVPLISLTGLLLRPAWRAANLLNIYRDRHWAWAWSLYTGMAATGWIAGQMLILQYYFWLQPAVIITGMLILILTLMPRVMRYYETLYLRKRY